MNAVEDMTEDTYRSSNQHIDDLRKSSKDSKKQAKTNRNRTFTWRRIHRSPSPTRRVPFADMGCSYTNGSAVSTEENYVEHVRSDLYWAADV